MLLTYLVTVAENIFLGHEERFIHFGIRNTVAMNNEANRLLKDYGFTHIKAQELVDNYNFEDRKLIEIVKATYFKPKILVIDETTTALSQEGREELYKHMNRIREEGNTVIFNRTKTDAIRYEQAAAGNLTWWEDLNASKPNWTFELA